MSATHRSGFFEMSPDLNAGRNLDVSFVQSFGPLKDDFDQNLNRSGYNHDFGTIVIPSGLADTSFIQLQLKDGEGGKMSLEAWLSLIWGILLTVFAILVGAFAWQRESAVKRSKDNSDDRLQAESLSNKI